MMILSNQQVRDADAFTIQNEPILSIDLMERASLAFVECFTRHYGSETPVYIICGSGNNGGDGLAIGRILIERGYEVDIWIMESSNYSEDCSANLKRLSDLTEVKTLSSKQDIPRLENGVYIDALFGSGLNRPVTGLYAEVIREANQVPLDIVSVDVPSGLFADQHTDGDAIIQAKMTICFQMPKLAFLLPENSRYTGDWQAVDIGMHPDFLTSVSTNHYFLEGSEVTDLLRKREKFAHKGVFGRGALISGSYGKMGAAVLASRAALRSGIGLLTTYSPSCGYSILQTAVPEAMVEADENQTHITTPPLLEYMDVVGIGPGIGTHDQTVKAFSEILRSYNQPMVLDADALNILGAHRELMELIPEGSILTPHVREFERLTLPARNDFHRLDLLNELSSAFSVHVLLKGAHSVLATPEGKLIFNSTGNPGMATAGSGDVLTGILTALLSHYSPEKAARLGMFIHGLAGDLAAEKKGYEGLIASDIVESLPLAFIRLSGSD